MGDAYKPVWLEFDVFLRSSRTLESFGICACGQFLGSGPGEVRRTCTSKP